MTTVEEPVDRTYGGWRKPASPGIGPLKLIPSVGVFGGLGLVLIIAMTAGLAATAGFAGVALVVAAPAVIPKDGRSLYSNWLRAARWRRHVRRGRHLYRSGLSGVTPAGTRTLPGLLARVQLWSAVDAAGRDFALIEIPACRQWAVVLRVLAQGGSLVDPDSRNVWVASWGEYLTLLGQEGGVVQVAATVETAPDAGELLATHVNGMIRPDAPEFTQRVMRAAARELPAGVTDTTGSVALTFSSTGLGVTATGADGAQQAAEEIGRRLPGLSVTLADAGAADGVPLDTRSLAERARIAFDPAESTEFASARAEGRPRACEWADAGPSAHEERDTSYRHDSGLSRTWEAMRVPPGVVRDSLMERVMGPLPAAPRKRAVLLYRPVDAAETADLVDRDLKSAINRAGRRKGLVHAHDSADVVAAEKATKEEADGAGVVSFSLLVTATVTVADDHDAERSAAVEFDRACTAVERAARGARFRLSPVRGAQAAAFAGALGIGLSLADLSVVPSVLRDHV